LPPDVFENQVQAFTASGVDHFDKADAAFEVGSEVLMSIAVLALGTDADTVGQRCFEAIEFASADIDPLVGDEAREALPHAAPRGAWCCHSTARVVPGPQFPAFSKRNRSDPPERDAAQAYDVTSVPPRVVPGNNR